MRRRRSSQESGAEYSHLLMAARWPNAKIASVGRAATGVNAMTEDRNIHRRKRFVEELTDLLERGHGSEAMTLFGKGDALALYPHEGSVHDWLTTHLGERNLTRLIDLYAMSPCAFCRRGLEPCPDCDRHGHFEYDEICEACLGLGVCRCDFCNGSGLCSIDEIPRGLQVPVVLERARNAASQIEHLAELLHLTPASDNPADALKHQASLILRMNGQLGIIENELGNAHDLDWWTPESDLSVTSIIDEWLGAASNVEGRICAAFQSMAATAKRMAAESIPGSNTKQLAERRAEFFGRFVTPESLDQTKLDHPALDRLLTELAGPASLKGRRVVTE